MALRSITSLNLRTAKAMAPIERITLFKIPNEADRDRVLEQYKVLAKTATKVRGPDASHPGSLFALSHSLSFSL